MNWVLSMTYLWLKAGHIIFVIFWMAGLFMLPRYFVYHQEAPEGSPENAVWLNREACGPRWSSPGCWGCHWPGPRES
jgi:protoporphyrinogen IX oxidase